MTYLKSKELILGVLIFSLALAIFSTGIRSMSHSSPDEKRYIQSAEEMVDSGDWITPRYHGRPRFQKPILFYWLAALGISFFKGGWAGARLPSAVSGALVVLITYLLGKCIYNRRTGLFSAALLVVSGIFFVYSRLSTPDMATLFFMTLSIYVFTKLYFQDAAGRAGYIFFIGIALATLTKGLAGLLLPLIIITVFVSIFKKEGLFRKINIPLGLLIFLIIVLPWFVIMYKIHGEIYIKHIWDVETLNRVGNLWTGGADIFPKIFKNLLRYLGMTFLVFLPAAIFLPLAAVDIFRSKGLKKQDLFILFWIFTVIIFFTLFGTKKIHYLLSLAPALCLVMGRYFSNITKEKRPDPLFFASFIIATFCYILGISAIFLIHYLFSINIPLLWMALVIIGPVISIIFIYKKDKEKMAQSFIISSLLIFIVLFGYLLPSLTRDNGLLILSEKILSIKKEDEVVGVGSHFISHNRLASYLGMKVKKVNVDISDPKEQIRTSRNLLKEFLNRERRVFCLIIRQDYQDYLPDILKKKVFILDKAWYWKKPNQLKLDKSLLLSIWKGEKDTFKALVKNEIYLISNKP